MVTYKRMHQLAGGLILSSITILCMTIFYMAKEERIFETMIKYHTKFKRVDGISNTADVMFHGINIGYINDVYMDRNAYVVVEFKVKPEFYKHIKGFTYVRLYSPSLIGGKVLEIVPSDTGSVVKTGSFIPSIEDEEVRKLLESDEYAAKRENDVNENIENIIQNVETITQNLKHLSNEINQPNSHLKKTLQNVQKITSDVSHVSKTIRQTSPEIQKSVLDTQKTITNVNQMVEETKHSGIYKTVTGKKKVPTEPLSIDSRDIIER